MCDDPSAHPGVDRLAAYALLLLAEADSAEVSQHLTRCPACRGVLDTLPENALADLAQTRRSACGAKLTPVRPDAAPTQPYLGGPTPQAAGGSLASGGAVPEALVSHPRYEVLEQLGSGGMGVVYKARHRLMDRVVALKVIHPRLLNEPGMARRFRREVRAAARLAHPNIVAAYDAEQSGTTHFLVMEFVEGTDLERLTAGRQLAAAEACGYVRQAALGLQHAFERDMVHRDIKPQNLMRTPEGRIKILDFGLAHFVSEALPALRADADRASAAGAATDSGALFGTADYLAPEEAEDSRQADIRADIYSLGCTLYRLLAGRVPFPGGSFTEKVIAHRRAAPVALTDLRPDLPEGLARVVRRMMAPEPYLRYQTPAEAATALAPFATAGQSVLVVDDHPAVLASIRTVLERQGHVVKLAANGREALEQLRAGLRPAVILLDLFMPVMDGWQFLQQLRQDPALASIPTILVTAADPAQAEELARGAAGYLQKPIDLDELTASVRRHTAEG
jgi:CheY-like chemotaxis protein